jgi:hypothetical protein
MEGMNLVADIRQLPAEVGEGTAYYISGNNHSDDLFMFLRRRITRADGIEPNRDYSVDYLITFASSAPTGCAGIGGSPGESVYLKAGASGAKPEVNLVNGFYTLSVDKGNQSTGGPAASLVGTVGNGRPCEPPFPWRSIVRTHRHTSVVRSSPEGDLWLLSGTDSGYEGTTSLYYQSIVVQLTAR